MKCIECDETEGLKSIVAIGEIDPLTGQSPILYFCEKHFNEAKQEED